MILIFLFLSGFPVVLRMTEKRYFLNMEPIISKDIEILILGTYPGEESIEHQEYYFNNRNSFWSLLGIDRNLSYEKRKNILRQRKIGMWDMFKRVEREGSLDGAIISGELNDFSELVKNSKKLRLLVFNGKTIIEKCEDVVGKAKVEKCLGVLGDIRREELHSSSGANNGRSEERKKEWVRLIA